MDPDGYQHLIDEFIKNRSEAAFEQLVSHFFGLVYSCALRRTGDPALSEEISQNVFAVFARKVHQLKAGSGPAGWLHKATLHESSKMLRKESRHRRKLAALADLPKSANQSQSEPSEILPLVDEAVDELPESDRRMVILRFFEGRSFNEIARTAGKSAAACQKQTSRALEKLEKILRRRGVVAGATMLATVLATESAKAVPLAAVPAISTSALAASTSLTQSSIFLTTIQTMTYAKTKVAVAVAAAAALPLAVQVHSIGELKEEISVYEEQESKYTKQERRLAELEATVAALPPQVLASARSRVGSAPLALSSSFSPNTPALGSNRKAGPRTRRAGITAANPEQGAEARSDEGVEEALALAGIGSSLEEMMKNPIMKSLIQKQLKAQQDAQYGELLDSFDLDPERRAQIDQILVDRVLDLAGGN